jgi:hypothetical protein
VKENKQTFIEADNEEDDYSKYPYGKQGEGEDIGHWIFRRREEKKNPPSITEQLVRNKK